MLPFFELWRRDKLFVFIFLVGNLFVGHIGAIASLVFAGGTPGVQVSKVWASNIDAAALYTIGITLLTGAVAGLAIEVIDKLRNGEGIANLEYKAFWCVLAGPLVVFQAILAGNLIAKASITLEPPGMTAPASAARTQPGASQPRERIAAQGEVKATTPASATESKTWPQLVVDYVPGAQVFLWLLSMIAAFELFCLQRNPLTPDNFAAERTQELKAMATKADNAHSTSFDEKI